MKFDKLFYEKLFTGDPLIATCAYEKAQAEGPSNKTRDMVCRDREFIFWYAVGVDCLVCISDKPKLLYTNGFKQMFMWVDTANRYNMKMGYLPANSLRFDVL